MKKITILFLLIFAIAKTHAQDYQITFAGTGASTTVDSVKVENLTQCKETTLSGSDILHLTGTVGVNEYNAVVDNTLHIYPNPTAGNCTIDFEATASGSTTIALYDISGKRISQTEELFTKGHHTYSLSGIAGGIYMLKVESDKYSYMAKIVSSNLTSGIAEIKQIEANTDIDKQVTISKTGTLKSFKDEKSLIEMQYTTGDRLKLIGFSGGIYKTVFMQVPTISQTDTFNFVECTDADGKHYAVVQIGTQIWMAENLNVGTKINSTTGGQLQTNNGIIEKYCYNNDTANCNVYGGLYEWDEMMQYNPSDDAMTGTTQGICPAGWHIPTHHEWTTLERAVCTSGTCSTDFPYDFTTYGYRGTDEGGKLKENCSTHWNSPNTGATNESGFQALPGGKRFSNDGSFSYMGSDAGFWSATERTTGTAWSRGLDYSNADVARYGYYKPLGFSVRCLKD